MILTPAQLAELTGKVRYSAQRRVLDALRIPYRQRPDGTLVVFRRDVDEQAPNAGPGSAGVLLSQARGDLVRETRQMDSARPRLRLEGLSR